MPVPILPNATARLIFLDHHGLCVAPSGGVRTADLADVTTDLGFVQVDTVNTFGRAHDHILWARRQQYRPDVLMDRLHRDRAVFEHWTHDAAVIPIQFFPFWRLRMARDAKRFQTRWSAWKQPGFSEKIDAVARHIQDHGLCTSGDVGTNEARSKGGWWDWHPSKTALEYLWRSGQVSVARRAGFTKVYDLTERVIPQAQLQQTPDTKDTIDWFCNAALDRLGFATSGELAAFWDCVTPAEAKDWCLRSESEGQIIAVDVAGHDGKLRRSFARPDVLDRPRNAPSNRIRILSPFDPALRDRKRAERLFGFHYRIEIFVPAAKRQYGYYVFPVMEGAQMIGRIDMKADRAAGKLHVTAFWPESGVQMGAGRHARLAAELTRAARFAGCESIEKSEGWLRV